MRLRAEDGRGDLNATGIAAEDRAHRLRDRRGAVRASARAPGQKRFITQCGRGKMCSGRASLASSTSSYECCPCCVPSRCALRGIRSRSSLLMRSRSSWPRRWWSATVQAAKVLSIHCSAKKVDSQAALQSLTAIGWDFAQGHALARPQPLMPLGSSPDPTGIARQWPCRRNFIVCCARLLPPAARI